MPYKDKRDKAKQMRRWRKERAEKLLIQRQKLNDFEKRLKEMNKRLKMLERQRRQR